MYPLGKCLVKGREHLFHERKSVHRAFRRRFLSPLKKDPVQAFDEHFLLVLERLVKGVRAHTPGFGNLPNPGSLIPISSEDRDARGNYLVSEDLIGIGVLRLSSSFNVIYRVNQLFEERGRGFLSGLSFR